MRAVQMKVKKKMKKKMKKDLLPGENRTTTLQKMRSLSDLPDNILSTITSMLNIRDAGKTSVLSKCWKYVWVNRSDFTFNPSNILGLNHKQLRENWEGKDTLFVKFVDQIMQQRIKGSTTLKSFCLQFQLGKRFSHYIDWWIGYAIRNGLETLDLDLSPLPFKEKFEKYEFSMLRNVAENNGSLKHIRLVSCNFEFGSSLQKFNLLVSLRLKRVNVSDLQLKKVFESCPSLENLALSECSTLTKLSTDIGNNNLLKILDLKNLELSNFELTKFIENCPLLEELTLANCPQLTNLKICDSNNTHLKILSLRYCYNLNEMDLCLSNLHTVEYIRNAMLPSCKIKAPRLVNAFLFGIKNFVPFTRSDNNPMLENLVLLTINSYLLFKSLDDPLPEFRNVRQLFLPDFSLSKSSLIYYILKCFPMLQTLGLNTTDDLKNCDYDSEWGDSNLEDSDLEDSDLEEEEEIKIEDLEECSNETITKLELISFDGGGYQIDFLEYLLKNLTGLKSLGIGSFHQLHNVSSPKIKTQIPNKIVDPKNDIWLKEVLLQIIPPWLHLEMYE